MSVCLSTFLYVSVNVLLSTFKLFFYFAKFLFLLYFVVVAVYFNFFKYTLDTIQPAGLLLLLDGRTKCTKRTIN